MPEQVKRRPGRPRTGRGHKPRIDVTISQDVDAFLCEWGQGRNVSAYIEGLIIASPEYQSWKAVQR